MMAHTCNSAEVEAVSSRPARAMKQNLIKKRGGGLEPRGPQSRAAEVVGVQVRKWPKESTQNFRL